MQGHTKLKGYWKNKHKQPEETFNFLKVYFQGQKFKFTFVQVMCFLCYVNWELCWNVTETYSDEKITQFKSLKKVNNVFCLDPPLVKFFEFCFIWIGRFYPSANFVESRRGVVKNNISINNLETDLDPVCLFWHSTLYIFQVLEDMDNADKKFRNNWF